jgi:cation:H+ antiporter
MVVGNVMGSNLANILLIIGVSGIIGPIQVAELSVVYTVPILLFFTLGLLYIVKSGWKVTRLQGSLALCGYVAFMVLAFARGWR